MVEKKLPADPFSKNPWGWRQKVENHLFSDFGYFADQIMENRELQQESRKYDFPADPPPPPQDAPTTLRTGVNRSKFNIFRTNSCCMSN